MNKISLLLLTTVIICVNNNVNAMYRPLLQRASQQLAASSKNAFNHGIGAVRNLSWTNIIPMRNALSRPTVNQCGQAFSTGNSFAQQARNLSRSAIVTGLAGAGLGVGYWAHNPNVALAEETQSPYAELYNWTKREFAEIEQLHNSNKKDSMVFVGYKLASISTYLRDTLAILEMNNADQKEFEQFNQMVQKYLEEQKAYLQYDRPKWRTSHIASRCVGYSIEEAINDIRLTNGSMSLKPRFVIPQIWLDELTEMGKDPILRDITINKITDKMHHELFKLDSDDQKERSSIRNKVSLLQNMLSIVQHGTHSACYKAHQR